MKIKSETFSEKIVNLKTQQGIDEAMKWVKLYYYKKLPLFSRILCEHTSIIPVKGEALGFTKFDPDDLKFKVYINFERLEEGYINTDVILKNLNLKKGQVEDNIIQTLLYYDLDNPAVIAHPAVVNSLKSIATIKGISLNEVREIIKKEKANKSHLKDYSFNFLGFLIFHEILHCTQKHFTRESINEYNKISPKLTNIILDGHINNWLVKALQNVLINEKEKKYLGEVIKVDIGEIGGWLYSNLRDMANEENGKVEINEEEFEMAEIFLSKFDFMYDKIKERKKELKEELKDSLKQQIKDIKDSITEQNKEQNKEQKGKSEKDNKDIKEQLKEAIEKAETSLDKAEEEINDENQNEENKEGNKEHINKAKENLKNAKSELNKRQSNKNEIRDDINKAIEEIDKIEQEEQEGNASLKEAKQSLNDAINKLGDNNSSNKDVEESIKDLLDKIEEKMNKEGEEEGKGDKEGKGQGGKQGKEQGEQSIDKYINTNELYEDLKNELDEIQKELDKNEMVNPGGMEGQSREKESNDNIDVKHPNGKMPEINRDTSSLFNGDHEKSKGNLDKLTEKELEKLNEKEGKLIETIINDISNRIGREINPFERKFVDVLMKEPNILKFVEFEKLLKSCVSEKTEKTYRRPHRSRQYGDVLLKSERKKEEGQKHITVGIDCSGSISDLEVKKFLGITQAFASAKENKDKVIIDIVFWSSCEINPEDKGMFLRAEDVKSYDKDDFKNILKGNISSSGGTDIKTLFTFVDKFDFENLKEYKDKKAKRNPDRSLVIVTDGCIDRAPLPESVKCVYFVLSRDNMNYVSDLWKNDDDKDKIKKIIEISVEKDKEIEIIKERDGVSGEINEMSFIQNSFERN